MRRATLLEERFERRAGVAPQKLTGARTARVLFSPEVARWRLERGASLLTDGSALEEIRYGSVDWLVGEILGFRGEAEVLEPEEVRAQVGERAEALAALLAGGQPLARTGAQA